MSGGYHAGQRCWGEAGKVIVFGILKRKGVVRVFPVKGRRRSELTTLIATHTLPGSLYYTDERQA
jgi:transposase